jgi:hypothetical protein
MEIESSSLTESVSRDDLREVWGVEGRFLSCFAPQKRKRIEGCLADAGLRIDNKKVVMAPQK